MKDIDTNILSSYAAGTATDEQKAKLIEWLAEAEENRRFLAGYMSNQILHDTLVSRTFDDECEAMVSRLNARIDAESNQPDLRRVRRRRRTIWGSIGVAAAAMLVALAVLFPRLEPVPVVVEEDILYHYANNSSGVKSVLLADSTMVYLKPGAEIEYNVSGLDGRRVINIVGEGYFDVAKDPLRPMSVTAGNLSLNVLGTAFIVRNHPGEHNVEVILQRGSLRLVSESGTPLVRLKPNQKALYSCADGDLQVGSVKARPYVVEQFNMESLENVTIGQIVNHIEHIFGVSIISSEKNPERRYYFNFLKTDSIDDVLHIVEQLTGERCRLDMQQSITK